MPVDIASGIVNLDYQDVSIPGKVALVWDRRYSTALLEKPSTSLGLGWTCRYYTTLTQTKGEFAFLTPKGAIETFPDPDGVVASGGVIRHFGGFLEIFRQDQRYIVQSWNVETGEVWRYCFHSGPSDVPWKLRSIEDVTGQAVDLLWDGNGRLSSVRQRLERRELLLTYNRSALVETIVLQGPIGEGHVVARFEYDSKGRLVAARNAAGFADRFEYDQQGRLTREVVKDEGVFHYRYDEKGRCLKRTGLDRYNEKRLHYIEAIRVTEVTDSYERKYTYQYLPSTQITLEIDPLGGKHTTDYDGYGRIITKIDATGATTRYAYDGQGNRASVIDALGNTTTFSFNKHHQPLSVTDAAGHVWRRIYDGANRLVRTIDPLGDQWLFGYDAEGNVAEVANPKGARKYQRYSEGILQAVTDWLGNTTHFEFDAFGRVVERRGALNEVTRFRYDHVGNPILVTLPDGATLSVTYDQGGNMTHFVDSNGHVTRWRYGPCRRLLERVDPAGGTVRYVWGTERGRLEQVINEKGETYRFFRDGGGRIVRELSFDGAERQFKYNAEGHTTAYTNANGETIAIERDALHRVISQVLPDGEQVGYAFDPMGNLTQAVNADITVSFERDSLGRIVREVQGEHWVASHYDTVGNLIRTETSLGHAVKYEVDANGHVSKLKTLGDKTIEFKRNPYGQETARRMPGGARMEQRYDGVGRLIEQRVLARWQLAGAQSSVIPQHDSLLSRSYAYDRNSALTKIEDGRWGCVTYAYDPAERLLQALREQGTSESFEYDPTGNISRMRAEGKELTDEPLIYGPGNRLLQKGSTRFEYDAEGRRIKKIEEADSEAPKVWLYEWNALDRLKSVRRPDGQMWCYRYDALARRVAKQGPDDSRDVVWDKDVIVHECKDEVSLSAWIFDAQNFSPIATVQNSRIYTIISDHLGTPAELIDESTQIVWSNSTKVWGAQDNQRPTEDAVDCPIRFQGQWRDHESGLHYNLHRYYDPGCGKFISQDPIGLSGGHNLYTYAQNPISWVDPLGWEGDPVVAAKFEHQGQVFTGTNPTDRDPRPSGPTVPGLRGPNIDRADMHAEIEAMMKAHDAGLRGGHGTLTIDGLPACPRCKGDIKTMARALDLDSLTVHNNGQTITFSKEELQTMKEGGKGWKGSCGGGAK